MKEKKEPIDKDDLYHLCAYIAEALDSYGAIRYIQDDKPHVLLVVDEVSLDSGAPACSDRLVRLTPEFVTIEKERYDE